jgi:hypothetical protein
VRRKRRHDVLGVFESELVDVDAMDVRQDVGPPAMLRALPAQG